MNKERLKDISLVATTIILLVIAFYAITETKKIKEAYDKEGCGAFCKTLQPLATNSGVKYLECKPVKNNASNAPQKNIATNWVVFNG